MAMIIFKLRTLYTTRIEQKAGLDAEDENKKLSNLRELRKELKGNHNFHSNLNQTAPKHLVFVTYIIITYYWYSALGPVWAETRVQSGDWYGCYAASWASSQGQLAIAFPRFLDVPTFKHQVPPRPPRRERSQRRKWELWARMLSGNFAGKKNNKKNKVKNVNKSHNSYLHFLPYF